MTQPTAAELRRNDLDKIYSAVLHCAGGDIFDAESGCPRDIPETVAECVKRFDAHHEENIANVNTALDLIRGLYTSNPADDIAANPCEKIFDHKWLDPACVESGCQSLTITTLRERLAEAEREIAGLRAERDALLEEVAPFRPMSIEEAEQALDEAEGEPMTADQVEHGVKFATDPEYRAEHCHEMYKRQWQISRGFKAEIERLKAELSTQRSGVDRRVKELRSDLADRDAEIVKLREERDDLERQNRDYKMGCKLSAQRWTEIANSIGIQGTMFVEFGYYHIEQRIAQLAALQQRVVDDLRAAGWSVAVHNDYKQNGTPHTFWLFTKDGQAIKGEGATDAEALNQVRNAAAALAEQAKGEATE